MVNKSLNENMSLIDVLRRINESMADFWDSPAKTASDRGSSNDCPLHKVAIWGDVNAAKVLLKNGADINAAGEDDDTPLHRAIAGEKIEMARFLISQGADVHIENMYGNTSLDDAAISSCPDLVALSK